MIVDIFFSFPSDREFAFGQPVQHKVQYHDDHQDTEGHGAGHRLTGKGPVLIQLEADGLCRTGIQQRCHGEFIKARDKDQEPARCNRGEDKGTLYLW